MGAPSPVLHPSLQMPRPPHPHQIQALQISTVLSRGPRRPYARSEGQFRLSVP
ncbi:hypothetical protein PVK06_006648 [Gossypium arboreum]|uniref:Uncharacterized protein n=1 Tax=Gossypium arboreum TaxID=29729 RepID=A0ABR0QFU8_GOSAR|nr:hypothetical protein PVK06_006648 [Gossypium arboreum]